MDRTIGQQIEDLFLLHALDLELLEVDRVIDLRERFDDLRKGLVELTIAADLAGGSTSSMQSKLGRLSNEANSLIKDFFATLITDSQDFISELAQIEASFGSSGFNIMLGTDYFEPLDNASEIANDLIVMGAALPDLFESQAEALTRKFSQTVTNAARRNFTNDQIVARVRGTQSARNMRISEGVADDVGSVPNLTFSSPITARAQADASTAMVTAMAAVAADSAWNFVSGNPEVFQGIQHKSVLDLVTSQICRTYADLCWDLQFRPILGNKLPYPGRPPLHFRCRSQHVPIMLPLQDWPEALRNSMSPEARQALSQPGGLVSESGSFNSWFNSVDRSVRISTVGRTFNSGFEAGLVSGGDWLNRSAGVAINIKDYKQRVEKGFKR